MSRLHIVTDSSARFGRPALASQLGIHVLPNTIDIGGQLFREETDLSGEDFLRMLPELSQSPSVLPPTIADYVALFSQLAHTGSGIISVHPSRHLNDSWLNAQKAAQQVTSSSCPITVIDSRTVCAGQGLLVRLAAQLALEQTRYDEILQRVRAALERVYSIYYVDTLEYLRRSGIIAESRALLGTMLGIKILVSLEEGELVVTEKVRSRGQGIEHLVEYLLEFDSIEDAVILQSRLAMTEPVRAIQDRLSSVFIGQHFACTTYCAALAVHIGGDAMGIVVLESETEQDEDDFSED